MREIKFRAWNKEDKKMRYNVEYMFGFSGGFPYYDYILMQYTGIKDKNGVEIYEGDILKLHSGVGKVEYECGQFWVIPQIDMMNNIYHATSCGAEVIGNIHENPELLGE